MNKLDRTIEEILRTGTILYAHSELHRGKSYTCGITDESMADGDEIALCFKTSTKEMHMIAHYGVKAAGHIEILESPNWSGGQTGTQVDIYNRHRRVGFGTGFVTTDWQATGVFENSGNMVQGVIGLAGGAVIWDDYLFAQIAGGSVQRGTSEVVLKTGTQYAIRIEADAGSNAAHLRLDWYEETP